MLRLFLLSYNGGVYPGFSMKVKHKTQIIIIPDHQLTLDIQ